MTLRERITQYMSAEPGARGWFPTWWYRFHIEPFTTKQVRRELESMERDGLLESDHSQSNNTKWKLTQQASEVTP